MTEFKQAAEKAAEEIHDEDCGYDGYVPNEIMEATILKHFAPISMLHARMVALLKRVMDDSVNESIFDDTRAILRKIGEIE